MLVYRLEITDVGPYSYNVPSFIYEHKTYQDFLQRHNNTKRYPGWTIDNIDKLYSKFFAACQTEKKLYNWFGKRLLKFLAKNHDNCATILVYYVTENAVIIGKSKKQCAFDKTCATLIDQYPVSVFLKRMEQ